jgi:galactokinase
MSQGEHVDYSGYSVLPMAIERQAIVAISCTAADTASPIDKRIIITAHNTNAKYAALTIRGCWFDGLLTANQVGGAPKSDQSDAASKDLDAQEIALVKGWGSYLLAAARGLCAAFPMFAVALANSSVSLLVSGSVPVGSGLSR